MSRLTTSAANELNEIALSIRKQTLEMCSAAGTGHVNSSFSLTEILTLLYFWEGGLNIDADDPEWPGRDRLILSKGQASPVLYTTLAHRGFFPREWLRRFNHCDAPFAVHLQNTVPGVEMSSGSLGHGLGVGSGVARALQLKQQLPMVYVILGDAECYEGSVWESAMTAAHLRLNNLVVIVDRNGLGATDFTENMCAIEPLEDKWQAFGWRTKRIDGHNMEEIADAIHNAEGRKSTQPLCVIADTIKGRGSKLMTNKPLWHSRAPSPEQAEQIKEEWACQ